MKKRMVTIFIMICMLISLLPTLPASAGMSISIGEYVQMGTYYGQPILWRCVDIDENGPLMLSDKIICIKAFDAGYSGNNTTGSHSRNSYRQSYGSNYWGDSNMRSWLNSTASAGNVEWLCGNPPIAERLSSGYNAYDQEAGFLTNFTQSERNAIKEVSQKQLLAYPEIDAGMATTGTERHSRYSSIASVVANYDDAYAEYLTDKMFLLDVKQVNAVYNNSDILGEDYYIGEPTAECVENSEYKPSSLATGNKWYYWLRSPYSYSYYGVRYVTSSGDVSSNSAYYYGTGGVRPAFYLNLSSSSVKSGSGTESNPYVIDGGSDGTVTPSPADGNTNSTSNGAPIITSAVLTHKGLNYDIFNQAVTIEADSNVTAVIAAEVNANGNNNVKLYITQGVGKEIEITDGKIELTPGKDFSAGKTIYIMAIDEETGKSTSKATKLKISSTASGSLGGESGIEGLNFKLGQNTGFTIPDSVPVFGGTEIKWEFDFIPISVEYDKEDNNKINVVFGTNITKKKGDDDREYFSDFNFKDYKEGIKKAASKQGRSLKQLRNDFKMTNDVKMNMFGGNLLSGGSGEGSTSVDVAGYAEMYVTENGLKFTEGQLCLEVEFTYNYQGQIFIWVVPLYYEFGGGAGVGFEGDMKDVNPISFSPEFEAYITGKIKGSIGGGIGIAKVATAGAAGEAALNLKKSLKDSYFKADVDGSANFNVKVFGKTVAEKEFARGNFLIYETGNANGLISGGGISLSSVDSGLYSIDVNSVYENESRVYAENPTEWLGDEPRISLMSADYTNKNLHKLAENIYTEAKPQICEVDGKKIMVMQWDNTSRTDADRTMLVYSVYNEASKTWSEPTAVYDDGTADFYPCFNDGYLVWQNEKTTLTDDMTLADIAKLGEICVSKWNGNGFDKPVAITENDTLDTQPSVAKNNSDGVSVVWTTNSENDIMGTTGENAIMQSDFDGTAWSAPYEIKSDINAVTNITAGNINGDFCIAYVCDDDNDLNTIDDRDIRIINNGSETQLTNNSVLDSNPVFADNKIYYYRNGNIVYSDIDGSNENTVFTEAKQGLTDTFVADANGNGDIAIWWTKAENNGAEIYASLYINGEWSDEIKVTDIGDRAKYPSGTLNDDGSMVVAFNNGIEQDNEIVQTDLYTISVNPSYDLELTDAYFDENTMTAYAVVKNNGELTVDSYTVTLEDNQTTVTEPLKAGASAEIETEYITPSDLSARTITMSVAMVNGEEYNTDNNSAKFEIGHADIAVENVTANEDETSVAADISNIGYDDAQNVTVRLRDGSADGEVIAEQTLNLAAGESENINFVIDKSNMRFFDASKQLYITAEIDADEVSLGNNDGYVLIMSETGLADYETEILNYTVVDGGYMVNSVAGNNTDKAISCVLYSAVYDADGILKSRGSVTAKINANDDTGVDILVPCIIETGDTIKTCMLNDKLELLAKCSELVIDEKKPSLKTTADAGYYAETSDSEDKEGIIAFNSFFEQYNEYADEITQYGIYIYKTGAEDNKVSLSAATVDELIASEGKFYALVTGITADSFNSVVAAMPYVIIGDETITGDVCTYSVSQGNKWLGEKGIRKIDETEEMKND